MRATVTVPALAPDEAHAAIAAIALDLQGLADNLDGRALDYLNATLDHREVRAADLAGASRMIAQLVMPLDALIAQLDQEASDA